MGDENGDDGSVTAEPSFHGRLQLTDYMFNGATHTSHGTRRSPRLLLSRVSHSSTAAPSGSLTTPASGTRLKPASPTHRLAHKRRGSQTCTLGSTSSQSASREDDPGSSTSPRKKQRSSRVSSSYAPPSAYAHLPPLRDVMAPNLLILFIGLNPGVQTARTGHAYAHPSNLFWKLLFSSGITPVPCKAEEDRTLPERFSLGNTNIVARPSRNGAELSKAEMDAGVAILEEKCRCWRPEVVCVVGKGIWESIFRVWNGRSLRKGEFEYGWQTERMGAVPPADNSATMKFGADVREQLVKTEILLDEDSHDGRDGSESKNGEAEREETVDDGPWEGARIFVATSTSGLAATLRPEEKERIWKILGDWCVQRRKERAEEKPKVED